MYEPRPGSGPRVYRIPLRGAVVPSHQGRLSYQKTRSGSGQQAYVRGNYEDSLVILNYSFTVDLWNQVVVVVMARGVGSKYLPCEDLCALTGSRIKHPSPLSTNDGNAAAVFLASGITGRPEKCYKIQSHFLELSKNVERRSLPVISFVAMEGGIYVSFKQV